MSEMLKNLLRYNTSRYIIDINIYRSIAQIERQFEFPTLNPLTLDCLHDTANISFIWNPLQLVNLKRNNWSNRSSHLLYLDGIFFLQSQILLEIEYFKYSE